ncbi:cyclin-dependent kinase G-2 isoform X1 [Medicago truncatula]|uniref:cyclin-dependent kinase G-2 isoform X1 n=1 Tax=Medicago truncatula TaxID=3880 RepID=UPI000D2F256F|nr:cyclin-dependent kinase G-2 isoform X1 [Medicago truncatula]
MTTGGHGDNRDHEFRNSDSDFSISRRGFNNNVYHDIRNGKGRSRDTRDRIIQRQKDIRESQKEVLNGSYRSSSSRSDSGSSGGRSGVPGSRRCEFSVKIMDREPGELSSESGSDDGVELESLVKRHEVVMGKEFDYGVESESVLKRHGVATGKENESQAPLERKRKFSPIVWDQEESKVNNLSNLKVVTTVAALPPPPPLPIAFRESPNVNYNGVEVHYLENPELPTAMDPSMVSESVLDAESPIGLHSMLSEQGLVNGQVAEQPKVEDYVPTRNISSSRWASGDDSPNDEGEIIDEKEFLKRRRLSPESGTRVRNKMLRPDDKIKGFDRARAKSSESEERDSTGRYSGEDDHSGMEGERNNNMEIDGGICKSDTSGSHSNTDSESEDDCRESMEPPTPPHRVVNMLHGCRSVDEFERLNKINEGTYGVVYRAKDKKTGEIVALKKVKMEKEKEGFPLTSLREINILLSFHHPFIVDVKEVVVGSSLDSIFMVMEYMEHDLKGLMEAIKQPFSQSEVKCLMLQLLEGVKYLHDNWVIHRDLKTSNLLLNNRGELKICDFGLARQYGSPLKPYTSLVVTLWYRAPELLLGTKEYSTAIDMWSLGCIMAELLSKEPLFNGRNEFDQLNKIFRILGTPNETIWPGFSKLPLVKVNYVKQQYNLLRKKFPATSFTGSPVLSDSGFDLLSKLLTYDPEKRITAEDALNHAWFREVPLPKSKEFMPTFPAQHDKERRMQRIMKSPHPLERKHHKELQQRESGTEQVRVKWKSAFCPFC